MGRYVFKLPDVGEGTAEAEIVAWHVKVGEHIKADQNLVDVMTDKATVEMTSPVSGQVISLHGEPGEKAVVGAPLVELEIEGAGNKAEAKPAKTEAPKTVSPLPPRGRGSEQAQRASGEGVSTPAPSAPVSPPPHPSPLPRGGRGETMPAIATRAAGEAPLASPAVRKRAHELGIALQFVAGSGPDGRITHEDLDLYIATKGQSGRSAGGGARLAKRDGGEDIKIIGLRRKIAERMQESKRRIPHFAYVAEVDVTEVEDLRAHLNAAKRADQPKLTLLPFLMRALVRVIPEFPQVNARFDDEAGIVHRSNAVHIGIATQTANGLLVPVVRHAEALDVWAAAAEVARIAAVTRDNKATKDDLTGSTITITSLGPLGGVVTTPVINYPEVAIIGPNAIVERPVVRDGMIVVRKMMNLSSSFDHRVVDGYDAAQFIQRLRALLEHPATLFMD
jgi:2-oxoisovalerate dehydrogenase E2 component (dihydrolipoyl transacylase)